MRDAHLAIAQVLDKVEGEVFPYEHFNWVLGNDTIDALIMVQDIEMV